MVLMAVRRRFHNIRQESTRSEITDLARPPEWTVDSPCASTDPAIFHPDRHGGRGFQAVAKRLCWEVCTVREQCLEWALKFEAGDSNNVSYAFGIYGGLSANERKAMLKERASAAAESS